MLRNCEIWLKDYTDRDKKLVLLLISALTGSNKAAPHLARASVTFCLKKYYLGLSNTEVKSTAMHICHTEFDIDML